MLPGASCTLQLRYCPKALGCHEGQARIVVLGTEDRELSSRLVHLLARCDAVGLKPKNHLCAAENFQNQAPNFVVRVSHEYIPFVSDGSDSPSITAPLTLQHVLLASPYICSVFHLLDCSCLISEQKIVVPRLNDLQTGTHARLHRTHEYLCFTG